MRNVKTGDWVLFYIPAPWIKERVSRLGKIRGFWSDGKVVIDYNCNLSGMTVLPTWHILKILTDEEVMIYLLEN